MGRKRRGTELRQEVHKAGPLKQTNKRHKTGRHRTKGAIDRQCGGRTASLISLTSIGKKTKRQLSKMARRSQAKQLRAHKIEKTRKPLSADAPPVLCTFVSLCDASSCERLLELLMGCDDASASFTATTNCKSLSMPRFKCCYTFLLPDPNRLHDVLDALKVSDVVLLIWPKSGALTEAAALLLSTLLSFGLPTVVNVVQDMSSTFAAGKQRENARKSISRLLEQSAFESKFFTADSQSDGLVILRKLAECKKQPLNIQLKRPYMLVDTWEITKMESESTSCTLKLYGYVRGANLDVNSLIHLVGLGDFQLHQIDTAQSPLEQTCRDNKRKRLDSEAMEASDGVRLLYKADKSLQVSLESEKALDEMEGEQTWPTEEEIAAAEAAFGTKKKAKRVPKGTSEYQAAWILDEENEAETVEKERDEESSDVDTDVEAALEEDDEDEGVEQEDPDDSQSVSAANMVQSLSQMDTLEYDAEADLGDLEKFRLERENDAFPDEVDTPVDVTARVRFQRYRGLDSFRTSAWDPKENLPHDYARIFQFENYKRTKKNVLLHASKREGAEHGGYVCLHVANVPAELPPSINRNSPLVLFGLLTHERKMTLLNVVIRKHPSASSASVKSKEQLVVHVGYRRFSAAAIYSQHTAGDKHKFERFLPSVGAVVATMYAPIIFPPATVLVFREDSGGKAQRLLATGSVLDMNPDRIVLKRVVLSGHPYKINKKSAVVRYMFFNREDVLWFKPVELRTKFGRRGHVKEALGTHGHLKCSFDKQLKSQDTVLLTLYKRVYPKWTYEPLVAAPLATSGQQQQDVEEAMVVEN